METKHSCLQAGAIMEAKQHSHTPHIQIDKRNYKMIVSTKSTNTKKLTSKNIFTRR